MEELQTKYQILQERIKLINLIPKADWAKCFTHFHSSGSYGVFLGESEDEILTVTSQITNEGTPYIQATSRNATCSILIEPQLLEFAIKKVNLLNYSEEELIEILKNTVIALLECLDDLFKVHDKRKKLQSILDELNQNQN
jgi:hypothetical protein